MDKRLEGIAKLLAFILTAGIIAGGILFNLPWGTSEGALYARMVFTLIGGGISMIIVSFMVEDIYHEIMRKGG